jgi:hypothetical protein
MADFIKKSKEVNRRLAYRVGVLERKLSEKMNSI